MHHRLLLILFITLACNTASVRGQAPDANSQQSTEQKTNDPASPHDDGVAGESNSRFWQGLGAGAALAIFGGIVTYVVSRRLHKKSQPKKRIVCSATYCEGLLAPSLARFPGDLEVEVNGTALVSPVVVSFHIVCTGDATVNDVTMQVTALEHDRIIRWQFYVPQEVQCRRLTTVHEGSNRLEFKWDYLNPRDEIDLVLLVAPCTSARCVAFEADAEGLEVVTRGMRMDCSVGFQG